jgi:GT2 family glycosyltransferase
MRIDGALAGPTDYTGYEPEFKPRLQTREPILSDQESSPRVSVVTVTYGDRWKYLARLLQCLERDSRIERVIVVDNGAHRPIAPLSAEAGLGKVRVVRVERNLGSGAGFRLGLEALAPLHSSWIWLLDDDNLPESSALGTIMAAAELLEPHERGTCAFLAFRPEHQNDVATGVDVRRCFPPHSSFFGFHVADIPYKLWRRLPRRPIARELPAQVSLPYAPYSGLFFHRVMFDTIGTPKAELVLYADDTEFSHRIVEAGGSIRLLTGALLIEMEPSWNAKSRTKTSFEGWLKGGSDLRVFYASRNQAYFESHYWLRSKFQYRLNRFTYLTLLRFFAWHFRALERYRLFRRAIVLGEKGCLGVAPDYPLP